MDAPEVGRTELAARALIEQEYKARLAIVAELANGQDAEDQLLAQLAEVRQTRRQNWAEAQRLGWTPRDLKKIKLRSPTDTPRTVRRSKASAAELQKSATAPECDGTSVPAAPR
jgi:hypothetical protein